MYILSTSKLTILCLLYIINIGIIITIISTLNSNTLIDNLININNLKYDINMQFLSKLLIENIYDIQINFNDQNV